MYNYYDPLDPLNSIYPSSIYPHSMMPNGPCYDDMSDEYADADRLMCVIGHCLSYVIAMIVAFVVLALMSGCSTTKETSTSIERHKMETLMERMDSVISSRQVIRQDSAWRESVMRQFDSIREKSDTSHHVVVDSAGRVIKETLVINNTREVTSERERLEREVMLHRLETMDSTLTVMRQQQSHTDSLLQQKQQVVEKEVPASLTWWQQTRLHLANIILYIALFYGIVRLWLCRSRWLPMLRKIF